MPVGWMSRPAPIGRSGDARSKMSTWWPRRASRHAAAGPAVPQPMMAIRRGWRAATGTADGKASGRHEREPRQLRRGMEGDIISTSPR